MYKQEISYNFILYHIDLQWKELVPNSKYGCSSDKMGPSRKTVSNETNMHE